LEAVVVLGELVEELLHDGGFVVRGGLDEEFPKRWKHGA
jgi:hypothetical protein